MSRPMKTEENFKTEGKVKKVSAKGKKTAKKVEAVLETVKPSTKVKKEKKQIKLETEEIKVVVSKAQEETVTKVEVKNSFFKRIINWFVKLFTKKSNKNEVQK